MRFGRRRTALIGNALAIVSSGICMTGTTPLLAIGRFFLGVSAGVANVVFGKMITENMPDNLVSKFAMCHNASINVGLVPAFLMGAFLPDPDDLEANQADEKWRIIYLTPALIGFIEIVLVLFIFNLEPIAFCIMTEREQEGKQHMLKVYRKRDEVDSPLASKSLEELVSMHYEFQKASTAMDASTTTFNDAVCGRKYRKASWVCFFLNSFN